MSKTLVAYFSASGVTANAAKKLAQTLGSDLYEIKPEIPYSQKDLNWMNPLARSTKEMKGKLPYPALAPTIINRFLETYDFSGKKIILFATSGGSGFGKTAEKLRLSVTDSTEIIEGKLLNGYSSVEELAIWVNSITEDI